MKSKRPVSAHFLTGFLSVVAIFVAVRLWSQPIQEWLLLRSYTAPPSIAQLATADSMTNKARKLFYLNRPRILDRVDFNQQCPADTEKTIVLGCYHSKQAGIYIFSVKDKELTGVEQVTAAHEMLHAAYDRLSNTERNRVDGMLQDYYRNDLHDERIRLVIESYKKSEPNELVNEMHSIFGTELRTLTPELETYYQQYFTKRATVTAYAKQYQQAFSRREAKITEYDNQLNSLRQQITQNQTVLGQQVQSLQSDRSAVESSNSQAAVDEYNQRVAAYTGLLGQTNSLVDQYNSIVAKRNAIALEEKQLQQSLSSRVSPE